MHKNCIQKHVLLTLAGVTIVALSGDNGILTKVNDAKTNTEIAEEKEVIQLAYVGAVVEKRGIGDVTAIDLNRELSANGTKAIAKDNSMLDKDKNSTVTVATGTVTVPAEFKVKVIKQIR